MRNTLAFFPGGRPIIIEIASQKHFINSDGPGCGGIRGIWPWIHSRVEPSGWSRADRGKLDDIRLILEFQLPELRQKDYCRQHVSEFALGDQAAMAQ
jgi:hypothetical protein